MEGVEKRLSKAMLSCSLCQAQRTQVCKNVERAIGFSCVIDSFKKSCLLSRGSFAYEGLN